MKTYTRTEERTGRVGGFEIDNSYVGLGTVAQILSMVEGVTAVKRRRLFSRWEEIHIWFQYRDRECVVWEPYGDSSRYWIGQHEGPDPVDLGAIEAAFRQYEPPLHWKLVGDLLTLRFLKVLFFRGRADE